MAPTTKETRMINTGQLVPETILRKRHDLDELKARIVANNLKHPRRNNKISTKEVINIKRPEQFVKEKRSKINLMKRYNRVKKLGMRKRASKEPIMKTKIIPGENKDDEDHEVTYQANSVGSEILFVIRVMDSRNATPKRMANILKSLRLGTPMHGVFVKHTPSTLKMLQLVDPYVIYGPPSKQTITDLIKRRGHARVEFERVPISDNVLIEKHLGEKTGIICVEDLVEEIANPGEHFPLVARWLSSFQLSAIRTKFMKTILDLQDGKEYGDIGDEINEYIRRML